jgi:hypothetical protein
MVLGATSEEGASRNNDVAYRIILCNCPAMSVMFRYLSRWRAQWGW